MTATAEPGPPLAGDRARLLRRVLLAVRPRWRRLGLGLAAGVLAAASAVALLAAGAWLIARAAERPALDALSVAVVAVRAFALGRAVFRYLERLVTHDATLRVLADLRVLVYRRLERLAPAGLPAFRRGDLLARLVADVEGVQDVFLRALLPFAAGVLVAVASGVLVAMLLPSAALVVLAGVILLGAVVPWLTQRLARDAEQRAVRERAELAAQVVDTLDRAPELVAYGEADRRLAAIRATDERLTATLARSARAAGAGAGATALVVGLMVWATLLVGIPAVRGGDLSGVALTVLVLIPLALADVLGALPGTVRELTRSLTAAGRVFEVLDAPEPVAEPTRPSVAPAPPYAVQVRGLRARWSPDGPDALAGLDLDLPPGHRVALVGESGSGKTTAAMVLLRFLEPSAGRVTLSGVDLRDLDGDAVRRVVGLLAQDAHVFDSTIRENLRLARPSATDDELRAALRAARLLDWVDSLPDGLDARVGEHGGRLSGGQRQRLALARTLLADFPVVLLDEPGEHLDAETADRLTADLLAAVAGRTTLLVTHRLTGLEDLDQIVVLAAGRVTQRGTHAELMAEGGGYREAYLREQELARLVAATTG